MFKREKKCSHKKLTPFSTGDFCPDCGKEIEISWMILRCACCHSKRRARLIFSSIYPEDKYCMKCGGSECFIEKKETLDFFDVEYGIISKKEADNHVKHKEILQIWINKEESYGDIFENIKLIPLLIR